MENTLNWAIENWRTLALVLPFLLGGAALLLERGLNAAASTTVASVYRVALHAAHELQEEGIAWVRSPDGIAFRKELAARAYDQLPARIGPVPVGIVKMFVSRDVWLSWVEEAFEEACRLAERLELPSAG